MAQAVNRSLDWVMPGSALALTEKAGQQLPMVRNRPSVIRRTISPSPMVTGLFALKRLACIQN